MTVNNKVKNILGCKSIRHSLIEFKKLKSNYDRISLLYISIYNLIYNNYL
jgi:hypothetical protein